MIATWNELVNFFQAHTLKQYERNAWDAFLKHVQFHFVIPSIHITGTNGKGSTALKLHQIYALAGYRVGLYNSPSLESYVEMIQINGVPIQEEKFLALMNEFLPLFLQFHLTTFEMQTFIALTYFQREKCTFSVIEVGMGGLTDATNVFTPVLSILTNVTLEHQAYLGSTIEAIAFQKGGIIKSHVPALVGPSMQASAYAVMVELAQAKETTVIRATPVTDWVLNDMLRVRWKQKHYILQTQARYHVDNVATILSAVEILQSTFPVSESQLQNAFMMAWMPGRFETMTYKGKTIILDGAHNPGAMDQLILAFKTPPEAVLFACFEDKDFESMKRAMERAKWVVTYTTFAHPRARKKVNFSSDIHFKENPFRACEHLLESLSKEGVILITGSLAFIGLMRTYLKGTQ